MACQRWVFGGSQAECVLGTRTWEMLVDDQCASVLLGNQPPRLHLLKALLPGVAGAQNLRVLPRHALPVEPLARVVNNIKEGL